MSEKQPKLKFEEEKERTATRSPPKKSKVEQSVPQTIYTAEDRDIRGAETDYKKLEKELDKKIKRTPTDHPGYDEYRYHLDAIEHDPWQLTSFLTTLYDDYTRSEVQAKLKETFAKQYKLTTWVEVQTRYRTVVMIDIFTGIPYTVQVPYEYRIFHTKLVNKGLEVVIREELDNDQWKRYEIFQDTLGGRPCTHVLLILLLLLVMSAFSSCSILFSGTTQVSGQTIYTAEDRDIRGAETDYKKLERNWIKDQAYPHRPPRHEYRYHLDAIEHRGSSLRS